MASRSDDGGSFPRKKATVRGVRWLWVNDSDGRLTRGLPSRCTGPHTNYQATAVAQINQAINQVSQVVQTNSSTSEECAAASEELSSQAVHMREMISIYNLGAEKSRRNDLSHDISGSDIQPMENESNEQIISLGDGFGKY